MFRAVLSNPLHPEHGQATVPFPLREDVYPQTLELLRTLDLGNPTGRDCQIDEISGGYSVLKRLEGGMVNLDELDYLAKRLESFDDDQGIQFEAVAAARDISSIEDFINLPFCCDRVTVIYDFSDLEAVGRRHYLNTHGGCASAEELDHLDGQETALLLIDGGGGVITPYGVLYENGMRLEPLYQGGPFPAYLDRLYELELTVSPHQEPTKTTHLYLPASSARIQRMLQRGGIAPANMRLSSWTPLSLSSKVQEVIDPRKGSLEELNGMCRAIHAIFPTDRDKLDAVIDFARPECASQIKRLAEELPLFDFVPGVSSPEEYGRYMIQASGRFDYDDHLEPYYDYAQYGQDRMMAEEGRFVDSGYVSYQGALALEQLMNDSSEGLREVMEMR